MFHSLCSWFVIKLAVFIFLLYGPLLLSLCHSPAYSEVSNCNHGNNSHSTGLLELLEVDFRISSVTSEESAVQRGKLTCLGTHRGLGGISARTRGAQCPVQEDLENWGSHQKLQSLLQSPVLCGFLQPCTQWSRAAKRFNITIFEDQGNPWTFGFHISPTKNGL